MVLFSFLFTRFKILFRILVGHIQTISVGFNYFRNLVFLTENPTLRLVTIIGDFATFPTCFKGVRSGCGGL